MQLSLILLFVAHERQPIFYLYVFQASKKVTADIACGVRGRTTFEREVEESGFSSKTSGKLLVILEFKHYQRHVLFNMDGADYKNKVVHDGVRVLVAVRT